MRRPRFDEWYRERTLSSIIGAITPEQWVRRLLRPLRFDRLPAPDGRRRCHRRRRFSNAPELQALRRVRRPQLGNERNDYPASRNLSSQRNHTSNWFDLVPLWSTNLRSPVITRRLPTVARS